jgi:hypothetical protein
MSRAARPYVCVCVLHTHRQARALCGTRRVTLSRCGRWSAYQRSQAIASEFHRALHDGAASMESSLRGSCHAPGRCVDGSARGSTMIRHLAVRYEAYRETT